MPLFDYKCSGCGLVEERLVYASENNYLQTCSVCSAHMKKVFVARMNFREFTPQIIPGIDEHNPISSFGELKRRARNNWNGDSHEPLLVDNAPTESERRQVLEKGREHSHEQAQAKKERENA